jgi:hypothetical protein
MLLHRRHGQFGHGLVTHFPLANKVRQISIHLSVKLFSSSETIYLLSFGRAASAIGGAGLGCASTEVQMLSKDSARSWRWCMHGRVTEPAAVKRLFNGGKSTAAGSCLLWDVCVFRSADRSRSGNSAQSTGYTPPFLDY